VAAIGGAAAAVAAAASGIRTGQSLGNFLSSSSGPSGVQGGLEAVGLGRLIGADRMTLLSELSNEFAGAGDDLESRAARGALLDVLDQLFPDDVEDSLESVQFDASRVAETIRRYIAALIYNLVGPLVDEKLTLLEQPALALERERQLKSFIDALVDLRTDERSPLDIDWQGTEGNDFITGIVQAAYDQVQLWR
jgi:hypothetical protein